MINIFQGLSANETWLKAIKKLMDDADIIQDSRLGQTQEVLHANFHITDPRQRWVLSRLPAINPAFAIAEAIWILSGDNDAKFLNYWNPILPKFAGHGPQYYGAYGYRIRKQFGFDQLERTYQALSSNPDSRQVVIQIWDPKTDLPEFNGMPNDPDIPCNICSMPKIRNGKLEWLQIMRSNDLYRGTPYNVVQFTTLMEVLSGWLDVELGAYHQISDCLHIYSRDLPEVSYERDLSLPLNFDNLALPKKEFDEQLKIIYDLLKQLIQSNLSRKEFNSLVQSKYIKSSYQNMFLICAADCARRRDWKDEVELSLTNCTNELLTLAFRRWLYRYPV